MEKIIITIETVNDAFQNGLPEELARILRELADKMEYNRSLPMSIRDINGNKVGTIETE